MIKNIVITHHSSAEKPLHLQSLIISEASLNSMTITIPANHTVYVLDDSNCENITFDILEAAILNYRTSKTLHTKHIEFNLKEQGAKVVTQKTQHLANGFTQKHSTIQHHWANNTSSNIMVKNILETQTQSINQNTIIVEKNLCGVIAEQINKNLVLDRSAKIKTLPQLQIHTKNAHCLHGATTRGLSADDLFYAQSRGIEGSKAKELLINAFLK